MNQLIYTMFLFFVFVLLSLIVFYPIGYLIISFSKEKISDIETIVFSFLSSMLFIVLFALFLGIINLRILLLPTLLFIFASALYKYKGRLFLPFKYLIKDKLLSLLAFLGIIIQGFINFPSGYLYKEGLLFWSSQGHDGLWHVALIEEVKKTMPLLNPLMAGEKLYNYHYYFDIVMGEFGRIFPLFSSLDLYFRFFPVFLSFLISIAVYSFVLRWRGSKLTAYLATSFTWAIGSFGYILKYIHEGTIWGGETAFWASQGNTILGNPPHASAFALIPAIFLSFYYFYRRRNRFWFLFTFFLAFALAGFKVSAGVTVLGGLMTVSLMDFIFKKKVSTGILTISLGLSNFITINLLTRGLTSFLIFQPWWFIRTMVVSGDRLNWIDLELRRQHYASLGTVKGYLRLVQVETEAFLIFLIGNLGMRFIGLIGIFMEFIKHRLEFLKDGINMLVLGAGFTSFLMPILFIQRGITYNNIQFFQYFELIMGWFTAIILSRFLLKLKNNIAKTVVLVLFFVLSLPTVIGNFEEFYGKDRKPLAIIDNQLLEGLNFLKDHADSDSVILTVPFEKYRYNGPLPAEIYYWYPTPYVSALASRRTYLSAEEQLDITGYDWKEKKEKADTFFSDMDSRWNREFLQEEGIDYVLVASGELKEEINQYSHGLQEYFSNDSVKIYQVL